MDRSVSYSVHVDRCCHHHSHMVRGSSAVSAAAVGYLSHSAIPAEEEHSSVAAAGTLGDEMVASVNTGHDED